MTMQDVNLDDFLGGSGAPHCKYEKEGDKHTGVLLEWEVRPQLKFGSTDPDFWPDGNPKVQLVLTLQTDERDPEIEGDDGVRRDFLPKPSAKLTAFREALREANCKVERGLHYAMQMMGTKPSNKGNPQKLYRSQVKPPAPPAIDESDLF